MFPDPHTSTPSRTPRSSAPAPNSVSVEELVRYVRHASRPRIVRFWRLAGPLTTAQVLAFSLILLYLTLLATLRGLWLPALLLLTLPAALAYAARPLLLRRHTLTMRLINLAAVSLIAYALVLHKHLGPVPTNFPLFVLGYGSFHVSAIFWLLSDAAIVPMKDRWWHGR